MTLIAVVLTKDEAIIAADMRFTLPSISGPHTVVEDTAQKMVVVGESAAFAYTGIGRFLNGHRERVDEWMLKIFVKHDVRNAEKAAQILKKEAKYRFGSQSSGLVYHAFVGIAWEKNKRGHFMPCVYEISNKPPRAAKAGNFWFVRRHMLRYANTINVSNFGTEFPNSIVKEIQKKIIVGIRQKTRRRVFLVSWLLDFMNTWANDPRSRSAIGNQFLITTLPKTSLEISERRIASGNYIKMFGQSPDSPDSTFNHVNFNVGIAQQENDWRVFMPSFVNGNMSAVGGISIEPIHKKNR